jgi:Au+-exporting ATPase
MSKSQISLPIQGMTCASCVSTIEGAISKVNGVEAVTVNLATERASVKFTDGHVPVQEMVGAVSDVGYEVGIEKTQLPIGGMTC